MIKICFIGGSGADSERLCGPHRMYFELSKRLSSNFSPKIINLNSYFFLFKTIRKIKQFNPKIIHGHGSLNMGLLLILLKTLLDKKIILTFTDFKKNITNNYKVLNLLDSIIVQSEYAKKRLIKNGVSERKIYKIVYGVEDSFYKAKECKKIRSLGKKIVLYYGDARYERGTHLFLQSFKHIDKDLFVLICLRNFHKGFDYKKIKNIEKNRKNTKIMLIDEYPCPIQDIIKSVDLVVLPFVKNTLEPPLTLMEVSVVGKPLITTDIGGNREIIYKKNIFIENISPKILAKTINTNINNKDISKIKPKKYPWEDTTKKIEKIYL